MASCLQPFAVNSGPAMNMLVRASLCKCFPRVHPERVNGMNIFISWECCQTVLQSGCTNLYRCPRALPHPHQPCIIIRLTFLPHMMGNQLYFVSLCICSSSAFSDRSWLLGKLNLFSWFQISFLKLAFSCSTKTSTFSFPCKCILPWLMLL